MFASYARKDLAILSLVLVLLGTVALWLFWPVVVIPVGLFALILWFFRDPERETPTEEGVLVSPADGTIQDIEVVREDTFLDEEALRIGIFMSILSVHVNRAPCSGTVKLVERSEGAFFNAGVREAIDKNNAVRMGLEIKGGRILVRQVSGVLARRIVNVCTVGSQIKRGQRIGMIKLGSRVEVYVARSMSFECRVRVGEKVKAGVTVLGKLNTAAKQL